MWCAACRMDAPALAVPEEPGVIRCALCGGQLTSRGQPSASGSLMSSASDQEPEPTARAAIEGRREVADSSAAESLPLLAFVPPPPIDDGDADVELRRAERFVGVLRQSHERVDPLQIANYGLQIGEQPTANNPQSATPNPQSSPSGVVAWACLTLGLMAFVCGGVLVGWSILADRGDLWSLGLPLTLGGQVGLVLGLLLQLDGLSQSTRRTVQKLTDLDGRLGELREVTALVSATHSAPAHSFYAHLSEGASPQILLADLKGQLDLLAQQMARQRKAA